MEKHSNPITTEVAKDIPLLPLRAMYVTMLRIRKFEESVAELLFEEEIKCPTHLYIGQEAIAVGVCANLQRTITFSVPTVVMGIIPIYPKRKEFQKR